MYMEEIKKQFQTLNNINEHWFSQIRKYIDDDNNFQIDEKILEEFNKLYVLLSENYKIDKNEVRKVCSKYSVPFFLTTSSLVMIPAASGITTNRTTLINNV